MISGDDVQKLADLARIELSTAEKEALTNDLGTILSFVDELKSAPIETDAHAVVGTPYNVMRPDGSPHEGGTFTDALLENAPDRDGNHIRVKNIL